MFAIPALDSKLGRELLSGHAAIRPKRDDHVLQVCVRHVLARGRLGDDPPAEPGGDVSLAVRLRAYCLDAASNPSDAFDAPAGGSSSHEPRVLARVREGLERRERLAGIARRGSRVRVRSGRSFGFVRVVRRGILSSGSRRGRGGWRRALADAPRFASSENLAPAAPPGTDAAACTRAHAISAASTSASSSATARSSAEVASGWGASASSGGGGGEASRSAGARSMRRPEVVEGRERARRGSPARVRAASRSTAAADAHRGAASSDIALPPPRRRARGGRARRQQQPGRASTVYPLNREQAFLVKGPSEAKKLHLSHSLPRGASARASAMEAPPPADVAEEVLASLASPGMAGHLRGVLRAEDADAPYGALDLDAPPHGALDLDASSDESDEALMLAALAGAIARGDGRARPSRRPRPRRPLRRGPRPERSVRHRGLPAVATAPRARPPPPGRSPRRARAARARLSAPPWATHGPARPSRAPRASRTTRGTARGRRSSARGDPRGAPAWLARDAATRLTGTERWSPPDPNATRPTPAGAPR